METTEESKQESDQLTKRSDKTNAAGSDSASETAGQGQDSNDVNSMEAGQVWEGQQPLATTYRFRSTTALIQASRNNQLPSQIMINFHPQRWTDDSIPWIRKWLMQNIKNVVKRGLIWVRG